ncbi:hypothetical protein [Hymenobacter sp. GOD-10R]|uniref:hypothetical protein n=1 Tax=Hymenobacter sp. GOD-10R TaxID=3093922 RepID=UPI002D77D4AA|nr:hypothetical protein [Hymenobacter sp. GOD-10R]WRQ31288.1 hypothetical protein SD425_13560 [Hymenobacter sp. GOD-10R]
MALFLKLVAAGLLVASAALSARQGWAMLQGRPAVVALLEPLGMSRSGQVALGAVVLLGAVGTLLPATFWAGGYTSAACILLILTLQLTHHNLPGAAAEVPFLLLALLVLYLGHPLARY